MLINEKDTKNLINLLTGLGNLLYNNESNRSIAIDMDIPVNLKEMKFEGSDDEINYLKELQIYIINILK